MYFTRKCPAQKCVEPIIYVGLSIILLNELSYALHGVISATEDFISAFDCTGTYQQLFRNNSLKVESCFVVGICNAFNVRIPF